MTVKSVAIVLALSAGALALALVYGTLRWEEGTRTLRARLDTARTASAPAPARFDARALDTLPLSVQRYLRAVLSDGQPAIASVDIEHAGSLNMSETGQDWKRFTSTQKVIARRPGFDWNARVAMLPGLPVRVHDAYVAGEGILHAALLGLLPVADQRGGGDIARGELMRFLAEAAWYPTVLLPGNGVRWDAVDARTAHATLSDGDLSVALTFGFNDDGLLDTVRADARGRSIGGQTVPTPWQGRFWNYELRQGIRIPLEGEVAWLLPGRAHPYWRGRITRIAYQFAE